MVTVRFFLMSTLFCWWGSVYAPMLFMGPQPDSLENIVTDMIDQTQRRIWVAMYRLTAASCVHALARAKRRGVDVRIILDKGMLDLPVYAFVRRECLHAGIEIFWSGGGPLMHHKWALFDNRVLIGSVNWTRSGFTRNHEQCVLLPDRSSAQLCATHFMVLMRRAAGLNALSDRYTNSFFFIPDHRKQMKQALISAFAGARRRILVTMYALTSVWCMRALINAAQRNVEVRVVLEPTQVADEQTLRDARKQGVVIKNYRTPVAGGILHDKTAVIDDELWFGSMNWTGAGTRTNDESLVRIVDGAVVNKAVTGFEELWGSISPSLQVPTV